MIHGLKLNKMSKFQYQIVRYIHDRITGEFVNVGIIIFQPEINFLSSKFVTNLDRVSEFFNITNEQYLLDALQQFEREIENDSKIELSNISLSNITNHILPKDDSSLICSKSFCCIYNDPIEALEDLFNRLVKLKNNKRKWQTLQ